MQEDILSYLQKIANPFFNTFFEIITMFGEQYFLIVIITFIYWNISKKQGFMLSFVYLFSTFINIVVKISVRAKRPFQELDFIKGKRVHTATGYSFPSGHTQGATSFFVTFLQQINKWWFTIIAILIPVLIAISRVYLGVHWPIDVLVALILGIIISIVLYKYLNKIYDNKTKLYFFIKLIVLIVTIIAIAIIIINSLYFDGKLLIRDYFKLSGVLVGVSIGFILEEEKTPFSNKGSFYIKLIRFILGITTTMGIMIGLKYILPSNIIFDFIRYSIVGAWITLLYPLLGLKLKLFEADKSL